MAWEAGEEPGLTLGPRAREDIANKIQDCVVLVVSELTCVEIGAAAGGAGLVPKMGLRGVHHTYHRRVVARATYVGYFVVFAPDYRITRVDDLRAAF